MKRLTIIILSMLCFESCIENRIEDGWAKVRKSCSIEEYQEYLIENPNSIHLNEIVDSLKKFRGIARQEIKTGDICYHNCILISLNENEKISFNRKEIELTELNEKLKYSLLNPDYLENLPEKEAITIIDFGTFEKIKGIIDIISDKTFDLKKYSEIIILSKESILGLRNEFSISFFGKEYSELNEKQKSVTCEIFPMNIRFERYINKDFEMPLPPKLDN